MDNNKDGILKINNENVRFYSFSNIKNKIPFLMNIHYNVY